MENLQPENVASLYAVSPLPKLSQRTEWAEQHVENFLALPFFSEFVFRNLRTTESRREEQVADFLILHRYVGILVEQKCQEDPHSRTAQRVESWARTRAKEAWSQMRRAFTRRKQFPIWCDHPRRGRVEFAGGLPTIQHGIVTVEVFEPVDLQIDAQNLPLDYDGVPITYLSVRDFLNLTVQLRSIPELTDYLTARRSLSDSDRRIIGEEESLFSFYLLNNGSFAGCVGLADARIAVASQGNLLRAAIERKHESDLNAHLVEHVADELANRNPKFSDDVPASLLPAFDPPERRQNYLEMQAAIADLRLRERAELGRALFGAIEQVRQKGQGLMFQAVRFDSVPEWVYVVGASKNVNRGQLLTQMITLMKGAMAFYEKPKCLVLVDRDGLGYEVALPRPGARYQSEHTAIGRQLFGNLRTTSAELRFLPEH